jgi:ribulose-5-phosphate 4-epimerase/fuculose-1-phosphate aldolase
MNETQSRDLMVELAASLFARGFSVGSAGNISMRVDDGFLITPTNSSLGRLDPVRIAKLDQEFRHVSGDPPSKEVFMHRAFYVTRADAGAIVHLHSTLATAVACLPDVDIENPIPPLTPYFVMRVVQAIRRWNQRSRPPRRTRARYCWPIMGRSYRARHCWMRSTLRKSWRRPRNCT